MTAPLTVSRGQLGMVFDAPRPSNTGAQIPSPGHKSSKIDWFDFTVKGFSLAQVATSFLGHDYRELDLQEGGARGHSQMWHFDGVTYLCTPDKPERGIKVVIPGQAMARLMVDHLELVRQVLHAGGSIARIDLAFDDTTGALSPDRIAQALAGGQVITHMRDFDHRKPVNIKSRKLVGNSAAFGSRSSSRYVRVYDKRLEQINRHKVEPEDLPPHWCRIELECHKRAALVSASALVRGGLSSIPSIIRGVFDLRYVDNEKVTRRSPVTWWVDLFSGAEIVRTGVRKVVAKIEDKLQWLGRSAKRAMGQVVAFYGAPVLRQLVEEGYKATSERDWRRILPPGQKPHTLNFMIEKMDLTKGLVSDCPF